MPEPTKQVLGTIGYNSLTLLHLLPVVHNSDLGMIDSYSMTGNVYPQLRSMLTCALHGLTVTLLAGRAPQIPLRPAIECVY